MSDQSVEVGDIAPDFRLNGFPDGEYSLSSFTGKVVVLAFYPADNSPVCTTQMRTYSLDTDNFSDLNATVLGISPQSVETHVGFASKNSISIPLLADTDKKVGGLYGVVGPLGFYRRSIFVINGNGIITYLLRAKAGLKFAPTSVLIDEIEKATAK